MVFPILIAEPDDRESTFRSSRLAPGDDVDQHRGAARGDRPKPRALEGTYPKYSSM